ncbi:hypothetical protein BC332_22142 [Capsicum chinense]|nr:hypothetical protein BC332_22142 [Capsicum chinense]
MCLLPLCYRTSTCAIEEDGKWVAVNPMTCRRTFSDEERPHISKPAINKSIICGIGGIGKTTLTKFVYNLNFVYFEISCFLANIRETSKLPNGLITLQKQLLSTFLKNEKVKISSVDEGIIKIRNALCYRKVLLVLDDVDEPDLVEAIFDMKDWFGYGSKIIVTRHKSLLRPQLGLEVHEVEILYTVEANELFNFHAFGEKNPISEDYNYKEKEYSEEVIEWCRGLPLALQVIASSLAGKSKDVWRSAIEKLREIPTNKIVEKLRLSYELLEDDHDQNLFLHLSCFFVGMKKDFVVRILDKCEFYTLVGIQNLIDKCLVTIDEHVNDIRMHELVRDMGRDIVCREAPVDPGKRTRLWHHTDSYNVLTGKTTLDISYSSSLESLPMGLRMIDSLEVLRADGIGPNQILCTTNESKSMQALFSSWILKPRISPEISWTFLPSSLVRLSLVSCSLSDGSFPEKFSNLPLLEELDLSEN